MPAQPISFPDGAVECRPGDYIVSQEADGRCRVYRVRDILALERLVPSLTRPMMLTAEPHMLDSMAPAYADEVYLLLDALDPAFGNFDEAVRAVQGGNLGTSMTDILRPAVDFPDTRTQVVTGHLPVGRPG